MLVFVETQKKTYAVNANSKQAVKLYNYKMRDKDSFYEIK